MEREGRGYNKNCVLYPQPLTCQKNFLLFYMCQLWALHVVTKRQFFTFIINVAKFQNATLLKFKMAARCKTEIAIIVLTG